VGTPEWNVNDVSPDRFRKHLLTALSLGYRFRTAEELAHGGGDKDLAITFDDGLASVGQHAASLLKELAIPYTLFIVTDWADGRQSFGPDLFLGWREIEKLVADGATIGSHSVSHPNFAQISLEEAQHQLEESARIIESRLGIKPSMFAIPMGQSKDWSPANQEQATADGYKTIFAQSERRHPPGTIARTFITRFDEDKLFRAALRGAFDNWEEWY
jgi:peptidoglycan/xylan/chitin deacetylase (PgdA/CDA1 family)